MNGTITRYRANRLAEELEAQGRKARWLAAQVGMHEASISRIVNGKQTAREDVAKEIVRVINVPFFVAFVSADAEQSSGEAA